MVCTTIVIIAVQLFKGNAKFRSASSDLFKTNLFLINGQIALFGEMMDESMLALDVVGLVALGIQAAILWLSRKRIDRWWQARQRIQAAR